MLKTLLKKQLLELNRSFFQNRKTGKARSRAAAAGSIAMFAVLMVGVIGGMFLFLAVQLRPLIAAGLSWLYFCIFGLIAVALGTFGSVFNTYASVYQARDNDLLLSLPIPVRDILIVRLIGVYLMGLLYSAVVLLPAVIVYAVSGVGVGRVAGSCLFALLLSFFVLVLSCALGYVVARIAAKLKNKSLITVIVSLAFLAVYYFVYFKANAAINALIAHSALYAQKIRGSAYVLYLFGRAGAGEAAAVAASAAITAALVFMTYRLLARSFLGLAAGSGGTVRREVRLDRSREKSLGGALFGREARRVLSSPTYLLNCSLGSVLLIVAGAAALIRAGSLRAVLVQMPKLATAAPLVAGLAVCLIASMNALTAPSVSMEGKSLWIVQSLPIPAWQALRAKLRVHLAFTAAPMAVCAVCCAIGLRIAWYEAILMCLLGAAGVCFNALLGLALNLKLPNLTWTNETAAVKQSMSALLSLLIGWIYVFAMAAGCYFLGGLKNPEAGLLACAGVTAALDAGLLVWVKKRGSAIFASL